MGTSLYGPVSILGLGTDNNSNKMFGPTSSNSIGGTPQAPVSPLAGPVAGPVNNVAVPPATPVQAPQATTPNTSQTPPSATPTTPSVSAQPPASSSDFFGTVRQAIANAMEPNCLNPYYQTTYHWRLFMANDEDMISQAGTPGSVGSLLDYVNTAQQITIAESGVTGFNIRDVKFSSMMAGNPTTQSEGTSSWIVTITEPSGISFLDAMIQSAITLSIHDYTKAPFYMMLTFLGYDETGKFINNPAQQFTSNAGRWLWSLTCLNIDIKLTEAGAVYTCEFMPQNEKHIDDTYDIMRIPSPFQAVGDTVDALFKDYLGKLNEAWKKKLNGDLIIFDDIITAPISSYFPNPTSASGKDPKTFKMQAIQKDQNPNRSWWPVDNKYSVTVVPGYNIPNFIVDAIKHTEEGQALAKNDPVDTTTDAGTGNIRETITWVVEPVMTVNQYDRTSGHYQRRFKLYVSPHYSQGPILSRTQINNAQAQQLQMIQNYIDNGMFCKQYDYIFTGLNTEVIDIDLHWKMQYSYRVGAYAGALKNYNSVHYNPKTNVAINKNPQSTWPEATETKVDLAPCQVTKAAPFVASTPAANPSQSVVRVQPGNKAVPEASANSYIEDLLALSRAQPDWNVPMALWQSNRDIDHASGNNTFVGQMDRDQTIAGAVWSQIYDSSQEGFQSLKLDIRGDPFWLGQTNLHRQIQLLNQGLNVKANHLPDYKTGKQLIFVYFRYPVTIGDDFKPLLTPSLAFNGIYQVNTINHYFAEGVFKQELQCTRLNLIEPAKWNTPSSTGSSAVAANGSSGQQTGTSGASPPSSGNTASATSQTLGVANNANFQAKAPTLVQRLMQDNNLTQAQASGIVGNLAWESNGLNPAQGEIGGGGGFGLAQWTGSRRTDLNNYAAATGGDVNSVDTQYGFLQQELNGSQASALAAVKQTNNINDATVAFQNTFERPNAAYAHTANRVSLANQANALASATPSTTVASNPPN